MRLGSNVHRSVRGAAGRSSTIKRAPTGWFFSARMVPPCSWTILDGDGEAEAGAALLGGEVREEQAFAHLVGEAGAGVCDGEFEVAAVEQVLGLRR